MSTGSLIVLVVLVLVIIIEWSWYMGLVRQPSGRLRSASAPIAVPLGLVFGPG